MIDRVSGDCPGRSKSSSYKDLVWTVATASDENLDLAGQTIETLDSIEKNLIELGSSKSKILSAQVYITDMSKKSTMDKVWRDWIGDNPNNWPQRACLGVELEGQCLIEVTVTAVI